METTNGPVHAPQTHNHLPASDHFHHSAVEFIQLLATTQRGRLLHEINQEKELLVIQDNVLCVKGNGQPNPPFEVSEKDKILFSEIRTYLDLTFTEPHSLKSISRKFGINEFKLKKVFRCQFGSSVFRYILLKKMEYAFELIRRERKPINEVATIIGYKNSNHFSTAFKKEFGVVPSSVLSVY